MEPTAFSRFKEITKKNDIKFEAAKFEFDPSLTVVNIKLKGLEVLNQPINTDQQ